MPRHVSLVVAVTAFLVVPGFSALADTPFTFKTGSATTVKGYGHLNLIARSYDDGVTSKTQLLDYSSSPSRIGFLSTTDLQSGGSFVFNAETALGLPSTFGTSIYESSEIDLKRTSIRKFEAIWKTGGFGTFYLGQGSMASDGIAEIDFSGAALASYSSVADIGGGNMFTFGDGTLSTVDIGGAYSNFDGSRRGRIRYDTPKWGDFTLSLAAGREILAKDNDNDYYDAALRYDRTFGDNDFAAGIGYNSVRGGGTRSHFTSGSFAIRNNPTGLNGSFAAGRQNSGESYWYLQGGILRDLFSAGSTSISADYYDGDNFVADGAASRTYALSAVQRIDSANLEIYATLRRYQYDQTAANFRDGDTGGLGFRAKF